MFALAKPGKLQLKLLDYNVLLVELCPPSQGLLFPSSSPSPPIAKHLYWNYIAFLLPTRTKISLGFAASFFMLPLSKQLRGTQRFKKQFLSDTISCILSPKCMQAHTAKGRSRERESERESERGGKGERQNVKSRKGSIHRRRQTRTHTSAGSRRRKHPKL